MTEKATLTVKDLAEFLGIGLNAAYNLSNSDRFPQLRVGRRVLIPRQALERWVEENIGNHYTNF